MSYRLLRRALLQVDRLATRDKARRKLIRFAEMNHEEYSPVALAGLALSYVWEGDMIEGIRCCKKVQTHFPASESYDFCTQLLVQIYEQMGMKREAFEAKSSRKKYPPKDSGSSDRLPVRVQNQSRQKRLPVKVSKTEDLLEDLEYMVPN